MAGLARRDVVAGELVGPADSLAEIAAEIAERQRSPATRRTYAAVDRRRRAPGARSRASR